MQGVIFKEIDESKKINIKSKVIKMISKIYRFFFDKKK